MPHMTAFARNQWYVAAHSHEVGRELLGRTVLGEPLVLYRTEEDGSPVVLHDRCVHRRYPLSEAPTRLDGDRIVCGYHGFTYDTTGTADDPGAHATAHSGTGIDQGHAPALRSG